MNEFMTWLANNVSPGWIFMIFPLLFGSMALSFWRDYRKQKKLEDNPHRMHDEEYRRFNRERFKK
jgi:hypothetical protein